MAKALTSREHEVLHFIEQEWLLHGAIPTTAETERRGVSDGPYYRKCLNNADFRHALIVRGISVQGLPGEKGDLKGVLTPEQLVAANTMLDLRDNRSQKKKLTELGITTSKWEGWLRDPVFQNYLRQRSENLLPDNLHESHLALLDRVRSGDVTAIKYLNEITGRYVPNATDKVDVNAILARVLEVIQRHVTNPDQLLAIAKEFEALSTIKRTVEANMGQPNVYTPMLEANVVQGESVGMEF